ncbi:MAG: methyltransferase [Desulfosalsimonadaceae bacterium]
MEKADWDPGALLELSGYYWRTCSLHAGIKLDVFSIIGGRRMSAAAVAEALDAGSDGVERLLHALAAMGLLEKNAGEFVNTEASAKYLCSDSPEYLGWMMMHHHHLLPAWARLDEAVVFGRPVESTSAASRQEWRECFLKGMHTNARLQAPRVAEALELSGRKKLLDMGGGPGTYAIHFCQQTPGLLAEVFDLPDARPVAEANIEAAGLSDRIGFQEGDFHEDALSGRFDVVWISHILHAEDPQACRNLVSKAVSVLEPGGRILIQDFILDDSHDSPEFPALFSLNMLAVTRAGRAYCESEVRDILAGAGASDIERLSFSSPTGAGIISGIAR